MNSKSSPATDCFSAPAVDLDSSDLSFRTDVPGRSGLADLLSEYQQDPPTESREPTASILYNALAMRRWDESVGNESASILAEQQQSSTIVKPIKDIADFVPGTSGSNKLILPHINDEIFGFRLLHELGRGGFAKVFLAQQGELANRQMVLKISAIEGTEPQTLAQMQHTHVVPIYSVHEDIHSGLRAVCMPYLGGACLAKVIEQVWDKPEPQDGGRTLLGALDRASGPSVARYQDSKRQSTPTTASQTAEKGTHQAAHTPRVKLAGLSYVQSAAWIVARLAEGLQHSHERNVIHRDIKPSNILLSEEGQPLLLDFNVSQARVCNPADVTVGGTIPYMAPEQLRAMVDTDSDASLASTPQTDIYSLGLVLYEMLSGFAPFVTGKDTPLSARPWDEILKQREQPVPSLKAQSTLQIPWSLESIARKCLAPSPADRYASAGDLAEDLDRFLENLPLRFAPELSRIEQIHKWGRRHPRLTTASCVMLVAAMLIVPGALVLSLTRGDLAKERSLVTDLRAVERAIEFQARAVPALCMINTIIEHQDAPQFGLRACQDVLDIYQIGKNPKWQESEYWKRLPRAEQRQLAETAQELLLAVAAAHVRSPKPSTAEVHEALRLMDVAEHLPDIPASRAVWMDRARYQSLAKLGKESKASLAKAETIPATSPHDLYMLATAHSSRGTEDGYREAVRLLDQSISLSPKHYWSYFRRAFCQHKLHEPMLAAADLGACVGLAPQSSWAHFNRAYLLDDQGRKLNASAAYSEAIKYAPTFTSAYFNRGLARLELRDYAGALEDFLKVQELGRDDALIAAGRAMACEGLGRHDEADQLFEKALAPSSSTAPKTLERMSWTYAFAVAHRAPRIAEEVFDKILQSDSRQREALYGKGMLRMQAGDLRQAIRWFDDAVAADPAFLEPLRYRAVSLARLGELEQAVADANFCVGKQPNDPDSLYIAACVASISARKLKNEDLCKSAMQLLQRAITCGAPHDRALNDPDFSFLKRDSDFLKLVAPEQPTATRKDKVL